MKDFASACLSILIRPSEKPYISIIPLSGPPFNSQGEKTFPPEGQRNPRPTDKAVGRGFPCAAGWGGGEGGDQPSIIWNRKVTTWARVQVALGEKVVAEVPPVIPFSTAHSTAS